MSVNIVLKAEAPDPPYLCELIDFRPAATPFMLYGVWLKSQRYFWATPEDWRIGRSLLAQVGSELLMPCGTDIVNAVDRLYTLHDGVMRGVWRNVTGIGTDADPFVYDPVIEQAAPELTPTLGSLQHVAQDSYDAAGNLLLGETEGRYTDIRNFRQQLEDIKASIDATGPDNTEVVAKLVEIIALMA